MYYVEHSGVSLGRFFLHKEIESSSSTISGSSLKTTTSSVSRRYTVKDEFLQAIQVWAPRFRLFGTFIPGNENAGGYRPYASTRTFLAEDVLFTHVITCQGRAHVVNVQSRRKNLVIVNVHFEPELPLRRSRERLRLITPPWPPYPDAVGTIMGDFNFCEPEEGRFNVWNQTFTDGDTGKAALFHSLCATCSRDRSTRIH